MWPDCVNISMHSSLLGARDHNKRPVTIRGQRETRGMANIWGRKPIAVLQAEAKEGEFGSVPGEPRLRRTLSLASLIALGIGCIIGAGIFVLTGNAAAAHAGPAVSLSFILAGLVSTFAGLCYAARPCCSDAGESGF
jgi:amino acid permease